MISIKDVFLGSAPECRGEEEEEEEEEALLSK